uniref:C2H2-type domain-containing protein n=1 Tax=Ciona savignyi TaxID=51511 RepID=H2ZG88_CIOSA
MLIDYYSGKFIMTNESCADFKKQSTLVLKLSPTLDDLKQTEARLMCNVEFCKKSFTNKAALQAHTLTLHTGIKNSQALHNRVNYFCSILTCPHSLKNETSPFLSLRALKQHIHGANFYLEQQCNKLTGAESSNRELDLPVHIETQTEMNFCQMQCTAQTQTRSDSSNNNNSTEIRSLDDLLNDIETQTDTLFTWPSQMNNVISSYTQTATEPDKEDDILSHLFNIETQTEW